MARRPIVRPAYDGRPRLDGLKQISHFLELSYLQVRRLWKFTPPGEEPLPLFTLSPGAASNAKLYAYVDELESWLDRRVQRSIDRAARRSPP